MATNVFEKRDDSVRELGVVPVVQYDRFDVAEHRAFAKVLWSDGKRYIVLEGIEDELFEVVLKAKPLDPKDKD